MNDFGSMSRLTSMARFQSQMVKMVFGFSMSFFVAIWAFYTLN